MRRRSGWRSITDADKLVAAAFFERFFPALPIAASLVFTFLRCCASLEADTTAPRDTSETIRAVCVAITRDRANSPREASSGFASSGLAIISNGTGLARRTCFSGATSHCEQDGKTNYQMSHNTLPLLELLPVPLLDKHQKQPNLKIEGVIREVNTPLLTSCERLSPPAGLESAGRVEFRLDLARRAVLSQPYSHRRPASNPLIPQTYSPAVTVVKQKSPANRRGFHLAAQVGGSANALSCVSCKRI